MGNRGQGFSTSFSVSFFSHAPAPIAGRRAGPGWLADPGRRAGEECCERQGVDRRWADLDLQ